MADVFISYSKIDYASAEALASELTSLGIDVWWDYELYAGDDFHDVIMEELEAAKVAIVIWSDAAVASRWVRGEAEHAAANGKLIPLYVPGFDLRRIPLNFRALQSERLDDRSRLMRSLSRHGIRTEGSLVGMSASDYVHRADIYKTERNWEGVLEALTKAIALDSSNGGLYYERADCYERLSGIMQADALAAGRVEYPAEVDEFKDRAFADYNKVISLDSHNAEAYVCRGNCYRGKGQNNRALADFNKAIALDPGCASAYLWRGTLNEEDGYRDQALSDYNRAIDLNPGEAVNYSSRARLYEAQGKLKQAIADYRKAVSLDPKAHSYREALQRLGVRV
jgi:tetratricopeptide (TPR) repeat protein